MKIIKSNGSETTFSKSNIINAISKANMRVRLEDRFTQDEIKKIAKDVEDHCKSEIRMMTSNDIQNLVEHAIMEAGKYDVAVAYITYRYQKQMDQKKNTTDESFERRTIICFALDFILMYLCKKCNNTGKLSKSRRLLAIANKSPYNRSRNNVADSFAGSPLMGT